MKQNDPSHAILRNASRLGHEARAGSGDHAVLKLWLRLLASSTQIENEVRRRLRERFDISLGRFDYLAQLHRAPAGLRMSELSRCLMVTGGNVTGLTDDLVRDGLVARESSPADGRAWIVRLTAAGKASFEAMASEHEKWIRELFAGLDAEDRAPAPCATRRAASASARQRSLGRGGHVMTDASNHDTARLDPALAAGNRRPLAGYDARHFLWQVEDGVGRITLDRPERKNPLTFDSYAELRELFGNLRYADDVHAIVIAGSGGNFCSGGDVHEIIGPLTQLDYAPELLKFTTHDRGPGQGHAHTVRSRSSPPSMGCAPAQVRSWRWRRTSA